MIHYDRWNEHEPECGITLTDSTDFLDALEKVTCSNCLNRVQKDILTEIKNLFIIESNNLNMSIKKLILTKTNPRIIYALEDIVALLKTTELE